MSAAFGDQVRHHRQDLGLSLRQLAALIPCDPGHLSRIEAGKRHPTAQTAAVLDQVLRAGGVLRALAATSAPPRASAGIVAATSEGGEAMRRRDLLASSAAALLPPSITDRAPTGPLARALIGHTATPTVRTQELAAQVDVAWADFRACRYTELASRLPGLLASVDESSSLGARAYTVATRLLTKLHDDALASITADRAVRSARASGDPVVTAHATLAAAVVLRRAGHRAAAQDLMTTAADELRRDGPNQSTAMVSRLLAAAAYTAALRDQAQEARDLLNDAARTACAARVDVDGGDPVDVAVFRVSVARVLGDYGTAVDYARTIDPARITSPERRARYWEDTALALHGRGRPDAAFRALLAAERDAPQEVRYRPWAQNLTTALMSGRAHRAACGSSPAASGSDSESTATLRVTPRNYRCQVTQVGRCPVATNSRAAWRAVCGRTRARSAPQNTGSPP